MRRFGFKDKGMRSFKDWISCQLVSKSLLSTRAFNLFVESSDGELDNREARDAAMVSNTLPANASTNDNEVGVTPSQPQVVAAEGSDVNQRNAECMVADPLSKVDALQFNFLQLVRRIGQSPDNVLVAQVLYRLQLASLIRAGESGVEKHGLKVENARAIAAEQEAAGLLDLDFSFRVLVLGRTGVGKSATINSIFGETRTATNAYQPSTDHIQEVVGTINGIKVSIIDTPGLSSANGNLGHNRKLLLAVRKFIRKSPPDVVLYFERLDVMNMGYSNYPLLKLITDVFGSSIWFNTIIVFTHAASLPPEGLDGFSASYDSYVGQCASLVQHYVHQAVSSKQLVNPILLVENHAMCRTNAKGEKVLPNGEVWMSQFLLLCIATKVLADANSLLKFQDTFQLSEIATRLPSLPHLLSSLLRSRSLNGSSGFDDEVDEFANVDQEDEYDQLPPIRILTKAQFQRLSKSQKGAYLDELDYRETLFLKKQWKAEVRSRREIMLPKNDVLEENDNYNDNVSPETVQLPDMAIPLSFDSDHPVFRYRCILSNDQWIARPVLDSQGWDHDVGFDGINLEASLNPKQNLHALFVGQVNKEKSEFSIQSESSVNYTDPTGNSVLAGLEIQSAGKDLVGTLHGDAVFKNLHCNSTGCGLSLASYGNMLFLGAKIEDSLLIGRRCKITCNAGRLRGCGQAAKGGSLDVTFRGKDYPVRDDKVTLSTTLLSFDKEMVVGGSVQSDFRVGRRSKMSFNANLNSRHLGQICLKSSTSEHAEIALIAIIPLVQGLFRRRRSNFQADSEREKSETLLSQLSKYS